MVFSSRWRLSKRDQIQLKPEIVTSFMEAFLFLRVWGSLESMTQITVFTCWETLWVHALLVLARFLGLSSSNDSLTAAHQVVWWLNLASLGLYLIMVAVAAVTLKRGVSLSQRRMGRVFNNTSCSVHQNTCSSCSDSPGLDFQNTAACWWREEALFFSAGCSIMPLSSPWVACFTTTTTSLQCCSTACWQVIFLSFLISYLKADFWCSSTGQSDDGLKTTAVENNTILIKMDR